VIAVTPGSSLALTALVNWYRAIVRYRAPVAAHRHVPMVTLWGQRDIAPSG